MRIFSCLPVLKYTWGGEIAPYPLLHILRCLVGFEYHVWTPLIRIHFVENGAPNLMQG
jgi:hypothetical protein